MENAYEIMQAIEQKEEIKRIENCNEKTAIFGMALSKKEIEMLVTSRWEILKETRRIEFGKSILPELLLEFCDSEYIDCNNYADTIRQLQEIFYIYKNEMQDLITDEELISLMHYAFEKICFGDLELLESNCLDICARTLRKEGIKALKREDIREQLDYNGYLFKRVVDDEE